MFRLLSGMSAFFLVGGLMTLGCGESTGARIGVGQNIRNLCNYSVSGVVDETRCANDESCSNTDEYCWLPDPDDASACSVDGDCAAEELCVANFCYPSCDTDADCTAAGSPYSCVANGDGSKTCRVNGFCRQCTQDAQCQTGLTCDYGWCHESCTSDADCTDPGHYCTGSVCRMRHSTDFAFSNQGDRDLEIYTDETVVRGDADAAVFCDLVWSETGTVTLAPGDTAMLRVHFRPPQEGEFRAWIDINSSDSTLSPLPLLMCGQAVANECKVSVDGQCPSCASCGEDDFGGYDAKSSACQ